MRWGGDGLRSPAKCTASRSSRCSVACTGRPLSRPFLVVVEPPAGDLLPGCEPDILESEAVLDHLAETGQATGLAKQSGMYADRHHLRAAGSRLATKFVDRALNLVDEVCWSAESLGEDEARIVVDKRVRDDQVW